MTYNDDIDTRSDSAEVERRDAAFMEGQRRMGLLAVVLTIVLVALLIWGWGMMPR